MINGYSEVISLIERLHRRYLDVVKLELDRLQVRGINNVQALMLFNIGDVEMAMGELTLSGCYLGSNVSYNVKKMVENGYLDQERSIDDRRVIRVRLTEKGRKIRERLSEMRHRDINMLARAAISDEDLDLMMAALSRLERFWIRSSDLIRFAA